MTTRRIHKLLIANRGEIAVRIIHAAKSLGIHTIAACSEADRDSLPVQLADSFQVIGPARADQSYLNSAAVLKAAQDAGADAIHPGYGFLSESPEFAQQVSQAGLIFVGPDADTIRRMGDKAEARRTAMAAGVPVVPGSDGGLTDVETAIACATEIGYPLLIKASAGGGGRGIRVAQDEEELRREFPIAQRESSAAFGSNVLYLERLVQGARHIEVQILGDGENAIHLFERECSLQRRRQKVFEEAPSAALNDEQRQALCESAVQLARQLKYKGAGTLEYLFDSRTGEFFFIEMNTRIQVEHPVTEMVTGIDLVQAMLRIADGESLPWTQSDIRLDGWAIEMRINAEDPTRNFFPSPKLITELQWPQGQGIRIDSHIYSGYQVPAYYDSLLGKLIVHGADREQAFARAKAALQEIKLVGPATTLDLHRWLIDHPGLRSAQFDTGSLESWLPEFPGMAVEA